MKRAVESDKLAPAVGPFSAAILDGDRLYTSGQVALDPATGRLVDGDVQAQTRRVFANLRVVLDASGKTFDDVVKVNVYLTDMRDFAAMNEVYAAQFSRPFPARTTVAVAALPLGARVEIELVAR